MMMMMIMLMNMMLMMMMMRRPSSLRVRAKPRHLPYIYIYTYTYIYIYIYGDFLKLGGGTPIAGWLIMKHPFKINNSGGTHILGHFHMYTYVYLQFLDCVLIRFWSLVGCWVS